MPNKQTFTELFYASEKTKEIWKNHSETMKEIFRQKVIYMQLLLSTNELSDEYKKREWKVGRRHIWGYNTFNCDTYTNSGLMSEDCYELLSKMNVTKAKKLKKGITDDHYFGTSLAAIETKTSLQNSNYDIDYMVNEWLEQNRHLFARVTVLKKEHKHDSILRPTKNNNYTFEEKNNFAHYVGVSPLVPYDTMTMIKKDPSGYHRWLNSERQNNNSTPEEMYGDLAKFIKL